MANSLIQGTEPASAPAPNDPDPNIEPTWGYHPDGRSEIFPLPKGGGLPDGWYRSPAHIPVTAPEVLPSAGKDEVLPEAAHDDEPGAALDEGSGETEPKGDEPDGPAHPDRRRNRRKGHHA